jgi:hypothetical protein
VRILDGSEDIVNILFSKIERNNKHSNILILDEGSIKERQFNQCNLISAKGRKNGIVNTEDGLLVKNLLSLAQLTEKYTYGSRVFWYAIKQILRDTAVHQVNAND